MARLIKGIHHVSLKCTAQEEYEKEKDFYGNILGMDVVRDWGTGIMFDTGSGVMEISVSDKNVPLPSGNIRHFALLTDDPDACIEAVRAAGYEILSEPRDAVLPSDPPYPIRVAFVHGPLGEEIEFFCEK